MVADINFGEFDGDGDAVSESAAVLVLLVIIVGVVVGVADDEDVGSPEPAPKFEVRGDIVSVLVGVADHKTEGVTVSEETEKVVDVVAEENVEVCAGVIDIELETVGLLAIGEPEKPPETLVISVLRGLSLIHI